MCYSNVDSVDWCDENLSIVCEIFADEVDKENRANTHLSKTGYKNVIQRFKDRTRLLYTRMQFKNKWDKLKQDYGIWKQLVSNETGIGWDESGKNIVMTNSWWKKTSQVSAIDIGFQYCLSILIENFEVITNCLCVFSHF
jgi:hypothetical protein